MSIVFSLHELSLMIKKHLETEFNDIQVRGEVVQPKRHTSGHLYFTIKDKENILDCIAWKTVKLPMEIADGHDIVCSGKISSYAGRSKYQMIVSSISYAGIGAMMQKIEELKKKLQAEGIFDRTLKPILPKFPKTIGIITAKNGAVIHDMIHRLNDRYPCNVVLYPIAVQGPTMPSEAIAGLEYFEHNPVELIILARGGGSFEDLFGFNDELLVRKVAASKIPIVTAIGHETDTTLVDYASTLRAPTPTAAVELIMPDKIILIQNIVSIKQVIIKQYQSRLELYKKIIKYDFSFGIKSLLQFLSQKNDYQIEKFIMNFNNYMVTMQKRYSAIRLLNPSMAIYKMKLKINQIHHDIIQKLISAKKNIIANHVNLLNALSYKSALDRGLCRAFHIKHGIINSKAKAEQVKNFDIEFLDGSINVGVKNK